MEKNRGIKESGRKEGNGRTGRKGRKNDCVSKGTALMMAVVMVLSVILGHLPGNYYAQEETYFSVVLPFYEGCEYLYDANMGEKKNTGEVILSGAAGAEIAFSVRTEKKIETMELLDGAEKVWKTCQGSEVSFQMPEKDLKLFMRLKDVTETESEVVQSSEIKTEEEQKEEGTGAESESAASDKEPEDGESEPGAEESEPASDEQKDTESEIAAGDGVSGKEESGNEQDGTGQGEGEHETANGDGQKGTESENRQEGTEQEEGEHETANSDGQKGTESENRQEGIAQGGRDEIVSEDEQQDVKSENTESGEVNGEAENESEQNITEQDTGESESEAESELINMEFAEEQMAAYYTMAAAEADTPVPDTFKLVCSEYPDFPHAPDNMQKSSLKLAMTSRKRVIFYEEDGTKTTRMAYCLQPAVNSPGSGDTYNRNTAVEITDSTAQNRNLMKALYYLYGGPAWDKEITYADGSGTANLKTLLYNEGKDCTTEDEYYCLTHYILSYLYLGENGKWNYMYTTMPEGPVLNTYGVNAVKKIAEEISKLPVPSAELSDSYLTASYQAASGVNVTPSITYQAISENVGKIVLPSGVYLVNETKGTKASGTVTINGGDQFHLEAVTGITGKRSYTIQTTYAVDFTAMKLMQEGNYQDVGFSYYSGEKQLDLEVDWPSQGTLKIQKVNAETGSTEVYNGRYSLKGAVYGVYSDAACTQKATELVTDESGSAVLQVPLGNYYLKELQAPKGFEKSGEIYNGKVEVSSGETLVTVKDTPIKKKIQIQKKDAQTGLAEAVNEQATLAGAVYTIYQDAECKQAVQSVTTDERGTATSTALALDTYYIKETQASKGYLLDGTVYKVDMLQEDGMAMYSVTSKEQFISGSLSLMKYLDDDMEESILQDLYDAGTLAGIRFTLVHEDERVNPVVITTDRYGYASTGKNALQYGTWYLTEDPETTPEGYEGIRNVKIEITEDGMEKMYVVTNKPYEAYLCIQKLDSISGKKITVDTAEFQILDSKGNAISMPTFDGYKDRFATNEKGEIHLTKPLKGGTYSLVEVKAPEGYEKAEPIQFQIEKNAIFQEPLLISCEDMPKKGKIRITKIDQETGERCGAGFVFQIKTAEDILDGSGSLREMELSGERRQLAAGTVVDTITTDENGIAVSGELYLGDYEIQEVAAGEYYACNSEIYPVTLDESDLEELIVAELQIENKKTVLELEKQDSVTGQFMEGVTFSFWKKGCVEEKNIFVTGKNGWIRFENLQQNTTYCLQETDTLPGYVLDATIYEIYVDEQGLIEGESRHGIKLTNVPNVAEISKRDITGGEELPGAVLTIEDSQGNVVEQWTSGEEPHRIYGLPAGTYTLVEISAPQGYEVAERIGFTLTDSFQVQQIVMYDRPEEVEAETESETETETETELERESETAVSEKNETEMQDETEKETQNSTKTDTEKCSEKNTEKETDIVIINEDGSVKTGDMTPIGVMVFLAICSMLFCVAEILRRIN